MNDLYMFRVGNHDLNDKPGHTKACGALQMTIAVRAESLKTALAMANAKLDGAAVIQSNGVVITVDPRAMKITKRNLVRTY